MESSLAELLFTESSLAKLLFMESSLVEFKVAMKNK